jgi:hypothetical protein
LEGSWLREAEFLEFSMPFGTPRLMRFCDDDPEVLAAECNFHHARTAVAEMKAFAESAAQTAATGPLGDMPLAVLSHDPNKPQPDLPADLEKTTNDAWEKSRRSYPISRPEARRQLPKVAVTTSNSIVQTSRSTPTAE